MSDLPERRVRGSDIGTLHDSTCVLCDQELDRVSAGLPAVQKVRDAVARIQDGTSNTVFVSEKDIR